ncbi:hypothetical protein [Streptomyces sp. Ncost-T10-10d]|uniref:hypothetical protein n=1 Tax=Streptomyces sp. Ncost-T10-10d TaxID=1839774 RepID=UPI00081EE2B6|nr:hypothetical protein [Streptomyces sp. Ncost-T10-10d]SCF72972.1 hypothetical protein GA0115254_11416 [Streptomyces sp. Ncost-T10-10d]
MAPMESVSAALRPLLSPYTPITTAPSGHVTNPVPNTTKAPINADLGPSLVKKLRVMEPAKNCIREAHTNGWLGERCRVSASR